MKHVATEATGCVSKRDQTNLFAQLSKTLLENSNFDLFSPLFKIQKPASNIKSLDMEYTFKGSLF